MKSYVRFTQISTLEEFKYCSFTGDSVFGTLIFAHNNNYTENIERQ